MDEVVIFQEIVEKLVDARRVLFITGAGISADSGLPTYRGIGGLYNNKETEEGMSIEEVLSGQTFQKNPKLTWQYLHEIEKSCREASFNEAHQIIAQFEKRLDHVCVLTQNIDGFHTQASSQNVIEVHGNLYDLACTSCGHQEKVASYASLKTIPPKCSKCSMMVRPAVVLFGEMLIPEKMESLEQEMHQGFDMVFSIGTTSVFPYIAGPVLEAANRQVCTIEINPSSTVVSHIVTYKLTTTAKEALLRIEQLWQKLKMN